THGLFACTFFQYPSIDPAGALARRFLTSAPVGCSTQRAVSILGTVKGSGVRTLILHFSPGGAVLRRWFRFRSGLATPDAGQGFTPYGHRPDERFGPGGGLPRPAAHGRPRGAGRTVRTLPRSSLADGSRAPGPASFRPG